MNILLSSYSFAPSVGGIETVSGILAREFSRLGHKVSVVTVTEGASPDEGYTVYRNPGKRHLWNLTKQCDILFQSHISLNFLYPALALGKPVAITCHTWLGWDTGKVDWSVRLKRFLMRRCHCIAISHAFRQYLPPDSPVIFDPYEDSDFSRFRSTAKDADVVFMGRLVDNKGADLLIQAVAMLNETGMFPSVTIIGDGPERAHLEAMSRELKVDEQVRFAGILHGAQRGQEVSRHKIMVVPSRWPEPFGLVALEGIASGCAMIGSANGGLGDAIGPCGLLFPNGDAEGLRAALARLLSDERLRNQFTDAGPMHLAGFQPTTVAARYIEEFERILSGSSHA
jgi:glycosyltransferase involved in cell wall biosynthesis